MEKFISKTKELILDILFPKFCFICNKEGNYLCEDCFSLIDIFDRQYCPFCYPPKVVIDGKTCPHCRKSKNLSGLYCAASYDNLIVKKLINKFKYEPYVKELSIVLSSLIINYLVNLNNSVNQQIITDKNFVFIPVPLHKKKLKQRGFNQAEEIAKCLSGILKIPIFGNVLAKTKSTSPQVELEKIKRQENVKSVFSCQNPELIFNKKILLVDDVFTTGATLEECAKILKQSGAREIWGIVAARG